jgi:protein-ribulosamine 3-kinase
VNDALRAALERALGAAVGECTTVSGGDINDAYRVRLEDRLVFVKTNLRSLPGMFSTEARGLEWLRAAKALRVPEVLAVSAPEDSAQFLVLEWLDSARPAADFDDRLGQGLSALHRTPVPGFGLDHDNFIGSLPQANSPCPSWAEFFRTRRLLPQLERLAAAGRASFSLRRGFESLFARLPELLGEPEPAARLHGDLWGGNLHVGDRGEPCLIDPAVYGGHREIDLAMMRLFGGFSERVFAAYHEAFPLAAGARERIPLYQLYPLLVHANLFGGSYVGSVERVVASYA